ncbi:MAG: prefoldin subunit [Candidatus Anstonellales archaeon]
MIDRSKIEERIVEFQRREAELRGMIDVLDQWKLQRIEFQRSLDTLNLYQGNVVYKLYGSVVIPIEKSKAIKEVSTNLELIDNKIKELEQQVKVKGEALERLRSALEQELKG